MIAEWSRWTRHIFKKMVKRGEGWLAPAAYSCLLCGKSYKRENVLQLCSACSEAIPWVRTVKCDTCGRYEVCHDCRRRTETHFVHNRSAVAYTPMMKELLAQYKYRGSERLRRLMGLIMQNAYFLHRAAIGETDALQVITYVPLSEQRLRERGFNQAQHLAQELGQATGLPVLPLLRRTRHTDKQSFKARNERLDDLEGAFQPDMTFAEALKQSTGRRQLHILIVDDVYTTGSTLNQCAKTLTSTLKCRVFGISWSR